MANQNTYAIDEDFLLWDKKKNKRALGVLIKKYIPILKYELPKYYGNLTPKTILSYGKKYIIDAVKTYNPEKSKLSTHIVNNLKRLHRLNYDTSSTIKISEELRQGINVYKNMKEYLTDKYKREPGLDELADKLAWTMSKVSRMDRLSRKETLASETVIQPGIYGMDDPKLDYIYHDLNPQDKIIFQYKTGYRGMPILTTKNIAKKIKLSIPSVSIRASKIANIIKKKFGATL